jgi:hypothetical protein
MAISHPNILAGYLKTPWAVCVSFQRTRQIPIHSWFMMLHWLNVPSCPL